MLKTNQDNLIVDFVDVTSEVKQGILIEHFDIVDSPSAELSPDRHTPEPILPTWTPSLVSSDITETPTTTEFSDSDARRESTVQLPVATDNNLTLSLASPPYSAYQDSSTLPPTRGISQIYLDPPAWPLESAEEAGLLQHFTEVVSVFVSSSAHPIPNIRVPG